MNAIKSTALLFLGMTLFGSACRDRETRPDAATVDFTINWNTVIGLPGALEPGTDMSGVVSAATGGDLAGATLVSISNANPRVARIRFRCADGRIVETDIPLDGALHDTGCSAPNGRPIRVRVQT